MILSLELEVTDDAPIELFIHGRPAPQGSKSMLWSGKQWGKGDPYMAESNSQEHKLWRTAVAQAAQEARKRRGETLDGPLFVEMVFFMGERPDSDRRRAFPTTAPDKSKLLRATEDSLEAAGLIKNDARIVAGFQRKLYGTPMGARVRIWRMPAKLPKIAAAATPASQEVLL